MSLSFCRKQHWPEEPTKTCEVTRNNAVAVKDPRDVVVSGFRGVGGKEGVYTSEPIQHARVGGLSSLEQEHTRTLNPKP